MMGPLLNLAAAALGLACLYNPVMVNGQARLNVIFSRWREGYGPLVVLRHLVALVFFHFFSVWLLSTTSTVLLFQAFGYSFDELLSLAGVMGLVFATVWLSIGVYVASKPKID